MAAAGALVLAGLIGGWTALGVVQDPAATASEALAERTAVSGGGAGMVGQAAAGSWAWVAVVSFAAVLLVGLLLLSRHLRPDVADPVVGHGRGDRAPGSAARTGHGGRRPVAPESAWERLSRGEDPTAGPDPGERDGT